MGGATSTAIYLIRMLSSTLIDVSPFKKLFHRPVFGRVNFVHLPPHERTKLSCQAAICAFVDYSLVHKGA